VPRSCAAAAQYYTMAATRVVDALKADHNEPLFVSKTRLRDDVGVSGSGGGNGSNSRDGDDAALVQYYEQAAAGGDASARIAMGHLCT
jgi:hypothetical protein